jgi:hypothetical protein
MKAVIMCLLSCASLWAQEGSGGRQTLSPAAKEHLRQVIASLPPESELRRDLERGARGDGIRYPWMDKMRQQGVKHALVRVELEWRGKSTDARFSKIVYFSKYDWDCAQISNPQRLAQIRAIGLEDDIGKAAVQCTPQENWDHHKRIKHGVRTVELFDDEWLARSLPNFVFPRGKPPSPLWDAVEMDDVEGMMGLLRTGVDPNERYALIGRNLVLRDDPCMTTQLLKVGGDVNRRYPSGSTLLMGAVFWKAFANVKALLAAGADVNAKATNGDTALSIAAQKGDKLMIELLKQAGAHY